MEQITDRTANILQAVCERYIETGVPVTSSELYQNYDFGIKPAMIRWELNDLCSLGFLFQGHASAGRVPTDEAYRFYTRSILQNFHEEDFSAQLTYTEREKIISLIETDSYKELVAEFSDRLRLLSIIYSSDDDQFFERGLGLLCERLLVDARDCVPKVLSDFEYMQERLLSKTDFFENESDNPHVYVGESPLTRTKDISVIMSQVVRDDGSYLFVAIGPKRMDYRKSLSFFKVLVD